MKEYSSEYQDFLKKNSVDEIKQMYKSGEIDAQTRKNFLQDKARIHLNETLDQFGVGGALFKRTIENMSEGWEDMKKAMEGSKQKGAVSGAIGDAWNEMKG